MEALLRAVEQVRERIERHRARLQQGNEALTRYALIDPILRALGWDTEDPEQVIPEFHTETGRPDYGLILKGTARVMVEAKPLGKDLEEARKKGFKYAWENKYRYYVVTDGDIWEIWDMQKVGGERILHVQLSKDDLGITARKLLALWRPAIAEITPAPVSIIQPETVDYIERESTARGTTLSKLKAEVKPYDRPPRLIYFPDGSQRAFKGWKGLLVSAAEWVCPKLYSKQMPIRLKRKRFLLNSEPVHSDGKRFRAPTQIGSFWLETNFSAQDCVRHACRLLETVGVSPDEVRVEF